MKKHTFYKMTIAILMASAAIASGAYWNDLTFTRHKKVIEKDVAISSHNVKKIFTALKNSNVTLGDFIISHPDLTPQDFDEAYKKAVQLHDYDLAIKIYQLGATDCYQEGSDILLIAICAGRFDIIDSLATENYPITNAHVNAARSLVSVDQPNWAFIYNQQDENGNGYSEYKAESQRVVDQIITLYHKSHPHPELKHISSLNPSQNYKDLFGRSSIQAFQKQIENTLDQNYSFNIAKHGTQKRSVLVDEQGKAVAIIKSKNELLAQALDYEHFAKVPPVLEVFIPEYGQVVVQKWVENSKIIREHQLQTQDPSKQADLIEQLHHIRLLDIRLGNSDRNKGNLIVTQLNEQEQIIPIDHDLIMFYIPNDLDWQAQYLNVPFTQFSQEYLKKIDLENDAKIMAELNYSSSEIKTMKLRTTLLKMAAESNMPLKQIDMLFRFYYYDFLDKVQPLSAHASEQDFRALLHDSFQTSQAIVSQPTEVWKLLGNNFEFYI